MTPPPLADAETAGVMSAASALEEPGGALHGMIRRLESVFALFRPEPVDS